MLRISLLIAGAICVLMFSCKKQDKHKNVDCSAINATYSGAIKPIIDRSCAISGCHNTSSPNGNLTTYDGLLIRVKNGTLEDRVLRRKDMPESGPLSVDEQQKIQCWLDAGAPKN